MARPLDHRDLYRLPWSCPDMTVHQGELVWSCRLEERLRFGQWMRPVPHQKGNGVGQGKAAVSEK